MLLHFEWLPAAQRHTAYVLYVDPGAENANLELTSKGNVNVGDKLYVKNCPQDLDFFLKICNCHLKNITLYASFIEVNVLIIFPVGSFPPRM